MPTIKPRLRRDALAKLEGEISMSPEPVSAAATRTLGYPGSKSACNGQEYPQPRSKRGADEQYVKQELSAYLPVSPVAGHSLIWWEGLAWLYSVNGKPLIDAKRRNDLWISIIDRA